MKTRRSRILLVISLAVIALLLSACQVNFITNIKSGGGGLYTQEIGFQADEASMVGLSSGDENFCSNQNDELPPGTTIHQETRNTDETWCIYETPFASLEELKTIYGTTDTQVNELSLVDGKMTYDISLDLGGDTSSIPSGGEIYWIVTMPGKVIENNATEQDGNTLKWKLAIGQMNDIRAVSNANAAGADSTTIWYIVGAVAFCLCVLVLIIIIVVVVIMLRRKKPKTEDQAPVNPPMP